jgi:hypothetical protein
MRRRELEITNVAMTDDGKCGIRCSSGLFLERAPMRPTD